MMGDMDKFDAPKGRYEVTFRGTVRGEPYEEQAIYEGNPMTDPAAKLISGRDLLRGDNAITLDSGQSITFDAEDASTLRADWRL